MIVVVDYDMGNVKSVLNALEYIGAKAKLSADPKDIREATHIILPGVGAFRDGMKNLRDRKLIPVLEEEVLKKKKPFLGICIGMELLAKKSYEGGEWVGLSWIDSEIVRFDVDEKYNLKVPHIGWNDIKIARKSALLNGLADGDSFYFVHSYYMACKNKEDVIATFDYGDEFTACVQKENIFGTQFHPEKSGRAGIQLLRNFVNLKGLGEK